MKNVKRDYSSDLKKIVNNQLPILPLRNAVLFPNSTIPLNVGREKSIELVKDAQAGNKLIGFVAQKTPEENDPTWNDLYTVGVIAKIIKTFSVNNNQENVVVSGICKFRIKTPLSSTPYHTAEIEILDDPAVLVTPELTAALETVKTLFARAIEASPGAPQDATEALAEIEDPNQLSFLVASNVNVPIAKRQEILELSEPVVRLKKVAGLLNEEIQILNLSKQIQSSVRTEMDKTQREYFLREQLRAIKKELGEDPLDTDGDVADLKKKIEEKKLPEHANKAAMEELKRLARSHPGAGDYGVSRNYVEWLLDMPWNDYTTDNLDIKNAERVLNEDHYGLDKVKKRILEYLAVRKLNPNLKAPILCFVGPPGVGKTSLGKSIARAMGRKFIRASLGGVKDEAEIRGHRRTYVGAIPGKIIQSIKRVGSSNPLFLLDEVDKLGSDYRGDPSSALLEVLDPEQNNTFNDHYLDVDYDLSKVMFIVTANQLEGVPVALRDRMEVIELPGYTIEEKTQIAKRYLLPKQLKEHALEDKACGFSDDAVEELIAYYTREAGVRNLEREIAAVCRGMAKKIATDEAQSISINKDSIKEYLNSRKYSMDTAERISTSGIATGLAWTPVGGDILFIEATNMPGKGELKLTGKLGDVMKESAMTALSFVRANYAKIGMKDRTFFTKHDIHIHVPAGGTPKDGPSAGVTMLAAITSLLTGRPVRSDFAMTGEISLRGQVLPVGGIKEKVLAAKRAGITNILLPDKNRSDVEDMEAVYKEGVNFHFVKRMDEVFKYVLVSDEDVKEITTEEEANAAMWPKILNSKPVEA
jgi:ATP-dependent Lon protease